VGERVPGWYIDSVKESVKQQVSAARKQDTTVEALVQTLQDTSVPGFEDLTPHEHCTALATGLAVAIRMLADQ